VDFFGLRGQDTDSSDLDILVDPTPETTVFERPSKLLTDQSRVADRHSP